MMKMLAGTLLAVLLLAACSTPSESIMEMDEGEATMDMSAMAQTIPGDLNTDLTRTTDNGLFVATLSSDQETPAINTIQSWVLHVETPDGDLVEDAVVTIGGGMPQHNHGFPTEPEVTEYLGDGDYLVEGVRFQMSGWWEIDFEINVDGESDTVTFNVVLP